MGSDGNADDGSIPSVVHTFGDKDLSDVTFVVGEEGFKCHKMFLATRSSYFKAMFYSDFKEKNEDRVTIEANSVAFNRLMEMIYTGQLSMWYELHECGRGFCYGCDRNVDNRHNQCRSLDSVWNEVATLMQLADLFDVRSYTVAALENYLLGTRDCVCSRCPRSGMKLLIALTYNMEKFKLKSLASKTSVSSALKQISDICQSPVSLHPKNLDWLLTMA